MSADEYRVPLVLAMAREARKLPVAERPNLGPSELFAVAEQEADGMHATTMLYTHAMFEIGYIGPPGTTDNPDFEGYPVCPICGFVFEKEVAGG